MFYCGMFFMCVNRDKYICFVYIYIYRPTLPRSLSRQAGVLVFVYNDRQHGVAPVTLECQL